VARFSVGPDPRELSIAMNELTVVTQHGIDDPALLDELLALYEEIQPAGDTDTLYLWKFSHDDLRRLLVDPNVGTWMLIDDGAVVGFNSVITNSASFYWASRAFFAQRYPEHLATERAWEQAFIGFRVGYRRHSAMVIKAFADYSNAHDAVVYTSINVDSNLLVVMYGAMGYDIDIREHQTVHHYLLSTAPASAVIDLTESPVTAPSGD
jgi:Transketolase, pyrimidine binding domain